MSKAGRNERGSKNFLHQQRFIDGAVGFIDEQFRRSRGEHVLSLVCWKVAAAYV